MIIPAEQRVAVDAMGGDAAPDVVIEGARLAVAAGVPVLLVGDPDRSVDPIAARAVAPWLVTRDSLPMDAGAGAVRAMESSSIRRCLAAVRAGQACAAVSCGGSGATLVASVIELGMEAGVERPAIIAALPRADGGTLFLVDAGASVDCRADHLAQFFDLGSVWARAMGGTPPRVGLLSNGSEGHKGSKVVREAHGLLEGRPGYVGQVEPHAALAGAVDVLVADGFAGNVFLKTAEGMVELLRATFLRELEGDAVARASLPALSGVLGALQARLDWRARGGALLVGVTAPVVIGHGRADAVSVGAAIRLAHYAHTSGMVEDVRRALSSGAPSSVGSGGPA